MFIQQIKNWLASLSPDVLTRGLQVAITVVVGLVLVRLLAVVTQRSIMRKSTLQRQMIVRKIISYSGFFLVLMAVLGELGVKLTALLGAAGIVGIAVGFASQTSVSNIISGLFLISEKPFAIGDVLRIGTTTGIIQSIDLLSIKIRTFDNLFVRIPNEKILSSEVTNITRFPIRRMDIVFQVDYDQDLRRVREILAEIAAANPWSLDEPEPVIILNEFKESGVEMLLGLWFAKTDFLYLKNSIMGEISTRFMADGIRFAHPRRRVSQASDTVSARRQRTTPAPRRRAVRSARVPTS
jgi:small-conductance mechanosensitive channel